MKRTKHARNKIYAIEREGVDSEVKDLIVGLIVSNEFIQKIGPILDPRLIESKSMRRVAHWCLDYFEKHQRAPGEKIEKIWKHKQDDEKLSDVEADSIEGVLSSLNNIYEEQEDKDWGYEINRAEDYLESLNLQATTRKVGELCRKNRITEAKALMENFKGLGRDKKNYLEQLIDAEVQSAKFILEKITRPRRIVDPWLTSGSLNMIYGPRGCGKTWLAITLAGGITRSTYDDPTTIGTWEVRRNAPVYFVDGEMSEYYLQKRIRRLTATIGEEKEMFPLTILSANRMANLFDRGIDLTNAEWRDALTQRLSASKVKPVLILDNLASLTSGIDENLKGDWDAINNWLIALRHIRISVIYVHHAGKGGKQRGTSAREDNLDTIIKCDFPKNYETGDGAYFNVKFKKARNADPSNDLRSFNMKVHSADAEGNLTWDTEPVEADTLERKNVIISLLMDGNLNQTEIGKRVGLHQTRISHIRTEAIQKLGYLDSNGKPTLKGEEWRKQLDETEIEIYTQGGDHLGN